MTDKNFHIKQVCPACGSMNVKFPEGEVEACVCFDCVQLFVPENRTNPDKQMCNDCAFRPNSPERQDLYKWAEIIRATIVDQEHPFHCHKGLKCRLQGQDLVYLTPEPGEALMHPCAGWLAHSLAYRAGIPAKDL